MYAVIFRASVAQLDEEYSQMVGRLRELAFERYQCRDFVALTEGTEEITISYWDDEAAIRRWKEDAEHLLAQQYGRERWYRHYTVQVVEVRRQYQFNSNAEE